MNKQTSRRKSVTTYFMILIIVGLSYGMIECGAFESNIFHGYTILNHFPKYMAVSMLTLLSIMGVIYALSGSVCISAIAVSTFSMILGIVNFHMFHYHGSLFVKADLFNIRSAINVMSTYGLIVDKFTITIFICYALSLVLAIRCLKRKTSNKLGLRIGSFLLSVVFFLFTYLSPFAVTNDFGAGMGFNWDSLYAKYGVIPVLIENLKSELGSVHKPAGYNVNNLDPSSVQQTASAQEYPDVILILNETYYDLNEIIELKTDIDYMQNYNALTNALKGYAAIPGIGGGTNGSEYQYLTSNSLNLFTVGSPFSSMNMNQQHSAADYMKSLGYATLAAHPGYPATYRRQSSWPLLGFDEIYFDEDFTPDYYGDRKYITDASAFDDFLNMMNGLDADKPHFGFFLTIQNHGGWDMNDASLDLVHAETDNEALSSEIDEYLSCMYLSDQAIAHMTEALDKYYEDTGRKVIVCMLGDHGPSFMSSLSSGTTSAQNLMRYYQTPYFIWANYPIDTKKQYEEVDICDLAPLVFRTAGIPLSPYYQTILDTVDAGVISKNCQLAGDDSTASEEIPQYIDTHYTLHSFDEASNQSELMKQYFYLEYNNCGDIEHRKDELFFPREKIRFAAHNSAHINISIILQI